MTIVFILFLFLIFDFILIFLRVAINFALPLPESPFIVRELDPFVNTNLSALRGSVWPSSLTNTYLSSSNGKNVSLLPAFIIPVEFDVIVTSNCFLIVKFELVKSTFEIYDFGRTVYKELSSDTCKDVETTLKSDGVISDSGKEPSHIPVTVVTPLIVKDLSDTDRTLAKVFVEKPGFENATKFPTSTKPTKKVFDVVTVLIPEDPSDIFTWPIEIAGVCNVSAVKVYALPTIPYKDFTSFIPYDFTDLVTLVFSIPSKISFSPREKFPSVV